ncbi:uncharacterized protein LOC116204356 [Punica granatum]|uniref:Uncharacterized protein LOC116204356 n=1 Tax=Punica granatum TaxID=22663 RepID=A0A6P8DG02_PUNGR|nr:uncharacterized protein LOC116204356 [Punica granatum]
MEVALCSLATFPLVPLVLLLLQLIVATATISAATTSSTNASEHFIKSACSKAAYTELCESSLLPHTATINSNPSELIKTAMTVYESNLQAALHDAIKARDAARSKYYQSPTRENAKALHSTSMEVVRWVSNRVPEMKEIIGKGTPKS